MRREVNKDEQGARSEQSNEMEQCGEDTYRGSALLYTPILLDARAAVPRVRTSS